MPREGLVAEQNSLAVLVWQIVVVMAHNVAYLYIFTSVDSNPHTGASHDHVIASANRTRANLTEAEA